MWGLPSDGRPSTLHEDQELRRFPELVGVGDLEAVARDLAVVPGRGGETPHVLPRRDAVRLIVREGDLGHLGLVDRKSTRLNSSHSQISYAVFCFEKNNEH